LSTPRRENTFTSTTVPSMPGGTVSEVSRTSPAFSPKIARSSFSSGVSWVSPFGVILPTKISPGFTLAPIRTIPDSSRSFNASSETFGMSLVTSSLPSFVSRAWISNSSMWIDVNRSSFTRRSETRIASSKLYPPHGMNATSTLRPSASSPWSVPGPSAMMSPGATFWPLCTIGFWLRHVF